MKPPTSAASEKLYIKNMVCDRCSMVVKQELNKLGIQPVSVILGEAEIPQKLTSEQREQIRLSMRAVGFELIDDKRSKIIEQIKKAIIALVHNQTKLKGNLSDYLGEQIGRDYTYQSHLFSDIEGTTIEQYFIHQ